MFLPAKRPARRCTAPAVLVFALLAPGATTVQAQPLPSITPALPAVDDVVETSDETTVRRWTHPVEFARCEAAYRELLGAPNGLGPGWEVRGAASTESRTVVEVAVGHADGLLFRLTLRASDAGCAVEIRGDGHAVAIEELQWSLPPLEPADYR